MKAMGDDLPQRGTVSRGAAAGADGGDCRWCGRMGRAWAGLAGCRGCWGMDAGAGSAGDAEADVSRVVGEAQGTDGELRDGGDEWSVLRGRRCCGGFARRWVGLRAAMRCRGGVGGGSRGGTGGAASLEREAVLELLEDRLRDYDAHVVRVRAGDVGGGDGADVGGAG